MIKQPKHPKYRIAELLRQKYGELNVKEGIAELAKHCKLRNERTVSDWMRIEAGSTSEINHIVIDYVITFFSLQSERQLLTAEHKSLLKQQSASNA